ncbi:unnamed protein product [Oncorhynchus mykiss]|uniref:RING-type domain-containing protein n=1 Tax=Oncorhynchus mykiss TaxID=8022 RepID=A0A060X5Z2_ONCMY|nr:unnamed protein product [Oncorhynchus mykiss]
MVLFRPICLAVWAGTFTQESTHSTPHPAGPDWFGLRRPLLDRVSTGFNGLCEVICAVCLEEFKQKDELGICPCKHAFHRKCLIKWLEVRKVCPLCNMPVLQLAQQAGNTIDVTVTVPIQQPLPGMENLV